MIRGDVAIVPMARSQVIARNQVPGIGAMERVEWVRWRGATPLLALCWNHGCAIRFGPVHAASGLAVTAWIR